MGRRAAQLWKNQEDLTNLGIVNDKLTMDDQLRVRIALRMMRKAHTKTLRSEADKMRRSMGIVMPGEHAGEAGFASIQDDTVHIRSLDDIMVEARANFALTKDKRKEEKVSTKFGQLRPIFPALVEEIRHEQEEKQRARDEKQENEIEFFDSEVDGDYHRPSSITNRRRNQSMQSANSRNTRNTRPHSATTTSLRSTQTRHRLGSHESPARLGAGENRTRNLSKATLASVEALQHMSLSHDNNSNKHRAELVPIKSSDVHAMNNSKKGRDLQQHLHNAHEMQHSHFNTGTAKYTTHSRDDGQFKLKRAVSFVPDDTELSSHSSVHNTLTTLTNTNTNTSASGGMLSLLKPANMANINTRPNTAGSGYSGTTTSTNHTPNTTYSNTYSNSTNTEPRSPSPSSKSRPYSPSHKRIEGGSSKSQTLHTTSDSEDDNFNSNMTLSTRMVKDKTGNSSRSSFFSNSVVVGDERINKALAQRDEILRSKEDEIRAKIRQKELQSLSKAELMLYEQRQRAWMIAVISLSRFKILADALTRKRAQTEIWDESKATKKAIGFIEKWWRRGRVRMMFRRHPHLFVRLKKIVMPFVFRRRLARKKKAADLIVMFLQDSTGMSETMRAIYAFRQTVIRLQRWIRKWIAIQHCRMRILWLKCERMFRLKARLEKINQAKEEKTASQHLAHVNYFSNTLHEISHRKKILNKILEDQELSRQLRQEEVKFQQENNIKKKLEEEERKNAKKMKKLVKMSQKETHNTNNTNALNAHSIDSASTVLNTTNYLLKRTNTRKENLPWHKKIRSSATNIKIYDHIRDVLKYERRRHVLNLVKHKKLSDGSMVGTAELKRYLKNPYSYEGVTELSKKLSEVQVIVQSPAQIYRTPFLLLTQGGNEALERLIRDNRHIKF